MGKESNPTATQPPTKMARAGVWKKKSGGSGFEKVIAAEAKATGKSPRLYAPEDAKTPLPKKSNAGSAKLRASITPGTVLILLAGKFRGKRVIFLKQLPSGLLLVTGPFKLNGVPLRRVNQRYVIATSTKVDIASVSVPEDVNDAFFKGEKKRRRKNRDKNITADKEEKKDDSGLAKRKDIQVKADEPVLSAVQKVDKMSEYLSGTFSLKA